MKKLRCVYLLLQEEERNFSPHIHSTWEEPFSAALYLPALLHSHFPFQAAAARASIGGGRRRRRRSVGALLGGGVVATAVVAVATAPGESQVGGLPLRRQSTSSAGSRIRTQQR